MSKDLKELRIKSHAEIEIKKEEDIEVKGSCRLLTMLLFVD